jgi:hypothetical protein
LKEVFYCLKGVISLSLYEDFEKLPTKCKEIFFDALRYNNNFYFCILDDMENNYFNQCDSPIEQIFLFVMEMYRGTHTVHFEIYPQYSVQVDKKEYIADFLIRFSDYYRALDYYPENDIEIIVECDGHDFHEKTKEQVKKNNERDLALKKAGYEVLHFSGSQIYNDYKKCVSEVADYFETKIGKVKKRRSNNGRNKR